MKEYQWVRFNGAYILSFLLMYMFSRYMVGRRRKTYKRNNNSKKMLNIFFDLIKVFNDGIIIADKDEIFYP
jgi:hypothetical protein